MINLLKAISPKGLYWSVPTDKKRIYVTFDDGPTPELTHSILKILREFEAKATFFCVGDNIRKFPETYEEIKLRGHATGNHTFNHLKGWGTSREIYYDNVIRCNNLTGSKLFRPPYGRITPGQVRMLRNDYILVMWSVLTRDYDHRINFGQCLERSIRQTRQGSIVVFHDNVKASSRMLYALPRYLEHFGRQGYRFEKLDPQLFFRND